MRCWGSNAWAQLGNGTRVDSFAPISPRGLANVAALALGNGHTCALLASNHVTCWGSSFYGQLGAGAVTSSAVPIAVVGL